MNTSIQYECSECHNMTTQKFDRCLAIRSNGMPCKQLWFWQSTTQKIGNEQTM